MKLPRWPRLILKVVELGPVLGRLSEMETRIMSATSEGFDALDASIDAAAERGAADIANLRTLLEEALAQNPDQTAEVEALRAEIVTVLDRLAASKARVDTVDPDPTFPAEG